jgi:hypothetical protein
MNENETLCKTESHHLNYSLATYTSKPLKEIKKKKTNITK